jgi:hypothetical protein
MDGDDFSRTTRLGFIAAESIWEAIVNDAPFDGFAKEVDRDLFAATR